MTENGGKVFRREEKISSLAREVMGLARDDILMHLRFFAPVVAALPAREFKGGVSPTEERPSVEEGYFMGGAHPVEEKLSVEEGYLREEGYSTGGERAMEEGHSTGGERSMEEIDSTEKGQSTKSCGFASDGRYCLYDSVYVLKCYQNTPALVTRTYLHMLLHCVFSHHFQYDKLETRTWDLAADLAVENVILELGLAGAALETDVAAARRLSALKDQAGALTAEKLYRHFQRNPLSLQEERELRMLSFRDSHHLWKQEKRPEGDMNQWRKLGRQVKADLQSFARGRAGTKSLQQNLEEAVREKYDYGEILRRFAVTGEELAVSEDEFDYIYYTYGLEHYGNLPLIEPLEYRESKKVREFVIAIDTSASCDGEAVKAFLRKTYAILKSHDNFFTQINVHILQCDNQVREDRKITGQEDLETFLREGKLTGFGATDFRPVFTYVEKLREAGEFENLKGLIYFTDGYGIYPERMPDYQTIFAFLEEDENRAPVPPWSMKVVV